MSTKTFSSPPQLVMGANALDTVAAELPQRGSGIMIVTDPGIVAAGILDLVVETFSASKLPIHTFTEVVGNPDVSTVDRAAEALAASGANIVVAVGGGSSMDVAKSVAMLATNGGSVADYEGVDQFKNRPLPIILVPTTVGSGSEVTKGAVITNHETNVKMVIVSDLLFATIAVLDQRVVAKLPGRIAATTGMDALTHAIEAYVAKGANPVTDAINLGAIELIGKHLVSASRGEGDSLYQMLIASSMAGIGFHDAGLGAVHALANTLGAHYGVHHGTANALFLPYVMDFNLSAAEERFSRIASALGENVAELSHAEGAERAAAAVHRLAQETGVPRTLGELDIDGSHLEAMAKDALSQADLPGNPRETSYDELLELYRRAL